MEPIVVSRISAEGTAIIGAGVTLAKVVSLNLSIIASKPLKIDFVEVIGLQDGTADDSGSGGSFDCVFNPAKHDVEVRLDQRAVALLGDRERGAISRIIGDGTRCREGGGSTRGEGIGLIRFSKCGIRRAGYYLSACMFCLHLKLCPLTFFERVAAGVRLGAHQSR